MHTTAHVPVETLVDTQYPPITKPEAVKCVFHEEATPSLLLNPQKRNYHCFGCGAEGVYIQFPQKQEQ